VIRKDMDVSVDWESLPIQLFYWLLNTLKMIGIGVVLIILSPLLGFDVACEEWKERR